ncbi:peptidoglycan editing factor PgeF [Calothrix sp. UHCC 0171]|uniref:peptidoglycan editing factor PgeF n=1 Tax=Calothrix sp. UHCC 0171 TaxID=3110245 RepID=UPI002B1F9F25|nr:peptidoglycan editing factor PgeF [Calothrix sp. UHCC 0171]MEA5569735.1 peptidoglycan editing factor PgeF [Calothrix sp. UHCC 0171]
MHTWHWRTWQGLPYLTCSLLESFPHGFFTQQFVGKPPQELTKVLQPQASGYRLKQVHGNIVLTPEEITHKLATGGDDVDGDGDTALVHGDGIASNMSQQAVWVASADCTPALIADVNTGAVAAVHAGWRGTAKKIVPVAISRLLAQGSKLGDIRVALGPAITGEVYQVSIETAAEVGDSISPETHPHKIVTSLVEQANSPILPDPEAGKARLDVRRVNVIQMENMGIAPEQIAIAPYCTFQTPEYFFSYRREREKKVQWSGIVSK